MKTFYTFLVLLALQVSFVTAQVSINSIGAPADNSAILDVSSDSLGMLIPRMTAEQREDILNPATGLLIFCTPENRFYFFNGTAWQKLDELQGLTGDVTGIAAYPNIVTTLNTVTISKGGTGQTNLTANKVLVGNDTSGVLQPANLHWDNINSRLGIGNISPSYPLHINGDIGWSGTLQAGIVPWMRLDNIPLASTIVQGIVQLSNSYSGGSQTLGATEKAISDGLATKANDVHTHNAGDITTGTLIVTRGGTGVSNPTANKILVGNGSSAVLQPTNLHWDNTNNRLGIGNVSPSYPLHVTGDVGWSGTLQAGIVPWMRLDNIPLASTIVQGIVQLSNSYSGGSQTLGATEKAISDGLATKANDVHTHNAGDITTGTLIVTRGGTGVSNPTANKILVGNGSSAVLQPTNLHWDNTTSRLGIGNVSPSYPLHVTGDVGWSGTLQAGIVPWMRLDNIPLASTIVQGIVQLSNSYSGGSQTLGATEKAISDGLATKANDVHTHNAGDITAGTLVVTRGGTGVSNPTANKVLVGNGASAVLQPTNLHWDNTNSRLGIGNISPSYPLQVTGDVGWSGTLQTGIVPWLRLSDIPYASTTVFGIVKVSSSYNGASTTLATNEQALSSGLATKADNSHLHNAADITAGTLVVTRGGTGVSNPTANKVLVGNGASAVLQPTNLHWDNINSRLGIGNISPSYSLHVTGDVGWSGNLQAGNVPWARLTNIPSASTTVQGIVQLSNSYSGASQILATTEKALTDGLGTKANSSHNHDAGNITTGTLAYQRGGTNNGSIGSAGAVAYSTGSAYSFSSVGTSGQAMISGGAGAPSWYAPTAGSILFGGTSGVLSQDNTNFFWDNTNKDLTVKSTATSGTAIIGVGNNVSTVYTATEGSGGAFTGTKWGVYGKTTNTSGERAGGYFYTSGSAYARVGGYNSGGVATLIWGVGAIMTQSIAKDGLASDYYCPVTPEIIISDFGTGKLINGKCHINIDPVVSKRIFVSEEYPMKVFVQLEGNCQGVFVSNKTANGFDVNELMEGKSDVAFSWMLTAFRNDDLSSEESSDMVFKNERSKEYIIK